MNKLSKEPYKGTRDFYPEDKFTQNYIFDVMKLTVESYGYEEYNASMLEETDLYRAKSGSEIINEQTYSFKDRGGRDVTIRPEMTPTAARMVARKRKELIFPLRWYSIPNMWRYEKPQRGRLREHWQLNVDIFGVENIEAEKEMIKVAYDIMHAFGVDDKKFIIKINNRKLVNYFLNDFLKLDEKQVYAVSKLVDRKNKTDEKAFKTGLAEILGDKKKEEMVEKFLGAGKVEYVEKIMEKKEKLEIGNCLPTQAGKLGDEKQGIKEEKAGDGINEIKEAIEGLKKLGIKNIVFDPSLMRGFDYYTGIVFEVYDTNPKNSRALFGGGRYDDLVGIFDVEKVSGVGFGMGDVTIRDVLELYNLLPKYEAMADLYICLLSMDYADFANMLAKDLREDGVNVEVDLTGRKIGAQIKTADKKKMPFVICIGEDEVKSGKFKLKHLESGVEAIFNKDQIADNIFT